MPIIPAWPGKVTTDPNRLDRVLAIHQSSPGRLAAVFCSRLKKPIRGAETIGLGMTEEGRRGFQSCHSSQPASDSLHPRPDLCVVDKGDKAPVRAIESKQCTHYFITTSETIHPAEFVGGC